MSLLRKFTIPANYNQYFKSKVLIITGVGRSGTTMLGKIIGSLKPVYYLFEPGLMKLFPFLNMYDQSNHWVYANLIRAVLFEDYFLQQLHGRNLNFNRQDHSFIGHYMSQSDIEARWNNLSRRQDVVAYLDDECPMFVIKTPEFQPLCSVAQKIFLNPKFIHLIRNGNHVISSTVSRGWYTDEYMNGAIVDWVKIRGYQQICNIPWYLDQESQELFPHWNHITRAASVWRCLTESGISFCAENQEVGFEFKYEDIIRSPELFVRIFEDKFDLKASELTNQHLNSIKNHQVSQYPSIYEYIEEPEREKYAELMERLCYLI